MCDKVTNAECLMQLLMAVGAVHIARPTVDYHNYLSQEADSHSEGVCKFFFTVAELQIMCDIYHWVDLWLFCCTCDID